MDKNEKFPLKFCIDHGAYYLDADDPEYCEKIYQALDLDLVFDIDTEVPVSSVMEYWVSLRGDAPGSGL